MWMILKTLLFTAPVLCLLLAPAIYIVRRGGRNRNLLLAAYVFTVVFFARAAVGLCAAGAQGLEISELNPAERIIDSMVHALQTFSMDEEYTKYLIVGKDVMKEAGHPVGAQVYGLIGSLLNVCAPVLGGALLLEILAGIFPSIRVRVHPRRHKFVFSELNDASITLAEDLAKAENYRKYLGISHKEKAPILIFTDAYPDETSEPRSELFERAAAIRAICVKTDLLHLPMPGSRSVSYFLMDKKNGENLTAIAGLLKKNGNGQYLWPDPVKKNASGDPENSPAVRICVFTQSDAENEMVWQACRQMGEDARKVLVRPIRDYMNASICLMYDVPLFLPLLTKEKPQDLYVTILGSGAFAEEACKAVFWCGQIQGVQLHIDVLAEDAGALRHRLEDGCPELIPCCRVETGEPAQEPAPGILAAFPDDPSIPENPPYCIFRFLDVDDPGISATYPEGILERTDYFIIALGEDAKNLRVSGKIRKHLMRMSGSRGTGHAVLAPVIFNGDLAALARRAHPVGNEPYVLPFADLHSRFSYRNVQMDTFLANADKDSELYDSKKQEELKKDEYTHWANLSRAVHYPYKLFGLGILEDVDVEQEGDEKFRIRSPHPVTAEEDEALAWVEHRRWNAFLRAQGFSCPTVEQFARYYRRHCEQGHPEMTRDAGLRFHPCLVERAMTSTAAHKSSVAAGAAEDAAVHCEPGRDDPAGLSDGAALSDLDKLDLLGRQHGKDYKQYDYKEYDADLMRYLQ